MSLTSAFPSTGAVLLAAGKGTRMHSATPKVLQRILEEPMLRYVYDALGDVCGGGVFTVVGHGAEAVRAAFPGLAAGFVTQEEQLGTGHALQCAWPGVLSAGLDYVLVINGDTPLVRTETLRHFLEESTARQADLAFITLSLPDSGAFGRVLRKYGRVSAIVEAKDYDEELHGPDPCEINAGIYCLKVSTLDALLPLLERGNKSGEYYITDLVGLAVERNLKVLGLNMGNDPDLLGINTPAELVRAEERMRERIVLAHQNAGAIIRADRGVRIGPEVRLAPGAEITGPCELYGHTRLEAGARVDSYCWISDAHIGQGTVLRSFCHAEKAEIGPLCTVGPYARLRPGTILEEGAHVGNFVEIKKARLGKGAKAGHLSYLGDAEIGAGANIGAGTITCNFDGHNKHLTRIGAQAFIGSNTALVAPVCVDNGALVGAGSVITKDVPEGHLGITRAPQRNIKRKK
ncbi:MAG: bifunctional UDP-N-acetylglucosamine diphosphorylase/glucosamine-1-phosphate N-acetyltransferase GlmU [Desulfovibrionaceae bacterium]|nr:bifunctional UDP-N-acetylglucosamine diphosphorylase/glucosamine-1-phosphate N-acetyltransferase GlmU [Desulfovibrionaceae bacterium]